MKKAKVNALATKETIIYQITMQPIIVRNNLENCNLPFGLEATKNNFDASVETGFRNNFDVTDILVEDGLGEDVVGIVRDYRKWYSVKLEESRWAVFQRLDDDGKVAVSDDGKTKVMVLDISAKSTQRYFPEGAKRRYSRLVCSLDVNVTCGVHLVLTYDPKQVGRVSAWENVWKDFKRFMDALNLARQRKFGGKRRLDYAAVVEEQSGTRYPHIHVWFPGLKWLWGKDLSRFWSHGFTSVNYRESGSVCRYIVKYIGKLKGWSDVGLAMLWKFRLRSYSVSRGYFRRVTKACAWVFLFVTTDVSELVDGLLGLGVSHSDGALCQHLGLAHVLVRACLVGAG
jgi:hypothetical protein